MEESSVEVPARAPLMAAMAQTKPIHTNPFQTKLLGQQVLLQLFFPV